MGSPMTIERNKSLIEALKAAPEVLCDRYRDYGQVRLLSRSRNHSSALKPLSPPSLLQMGILSWCSEFEDLVTEIKDLGFSGDMASETREWALRACSAVMGSEFLDGVRVQLISMYLVGVYKPDSCQGLQGTEADSSLDLERANRQVEKGSFSIHFPLMHSLTIDINCNSSSLGMKMLATTLSHYTVCLRLKRNSAPLTGIDLLIHENPPCVVGRISATYACIDGVCLHRNFDDCAAITSQFSLLICTLYFVSF